MNSNRKIAIAVGILYIIGTVSGVLSVIVTGSILDDAEYLSEVSAHENQIIVGMLFVLLMAVALAMIPAVIFPVFEKHNRILAIGYVVFRGALETAGYIIAILCTLSLIILSQDYVDAGAPDDSYFQTVGALLKEATVWNGHVGSIIFSLGALMLYYFFYQSKLIPRWLSGWGFIGAILVIAISVLGLFGMDLEVLWAPLALQEMVMALWLITKGFDASVIDAEPV
jgi:hypothetical protein